MHHTRARPADFAMNIATHEAEMPVFNPSSKLVQIIQRLSVSDLQVTEEKHCYNHLDGKTD